jgi:amino acid adenylation domain-containing protein
VTLPDYLETSATRRPDATAVVEPNGHRVSYAELNRQANALAGFLGQAGVRRGDIVGVALPKSISAVVAIFAVMKAGAAYVPVNYRAPSERGKRILADCQIRALIIDERGLAMMPDQNAHPLAALIVTGANTEGLGTSWEAALQAGGPLPAVARDASDLAYVLYTSGSTGIPKGIALTHRNGVSFVEWCSETFKPIETDRFSSHAPFHFDLSVLDIYLAVKHGAELHLIPDALGRHPRDLAQFIAAHRITIWYSTPAILTLLLQFGNLAAHDVSSLRLVLFAGEVFPVRYLRSLQFLWPAPDYYNLYGPTETNVCTFARIPETVPAERDVPYPIGRLCSHCAGLVLNDDHMEVAPGDEGVLYVSGPSVFQGYWNRPVENAAAFIERHGVRWYNTGDLVRWDAADGFIFRGRKDRMVKRRGYRIELGEIESALYLHPRVREVAVVSIPCEDIGVRIIAAVACDEGEPPSVIEFKTFSSVYIPAFMSPDHFVFQDALPKTSTGKIDYQAVQRAALQAGGAS